MANWKETNKRCHCCGEPLFAAPDASMDLVWSGCKKCNRTWIGPELTEDDPEIRKLLGMDDDKAQLALAF